MLTRLCPSFKNDMKCGRELMSRGMKFVGRSHENTTITVVIQCKKYTV